jgi:hypothetical protein
MLGERDLTDADFIEELLFQEYGEKESSRSSLPAFNGNR